ncbi:type II secretion system protein J [Actinotalea sp.]|uniref:PulJ/GspJ family protein n=1 Tax=Actinotalea sp. TaxID=1872145 RepID=UPI0035683806
MRRTTSRAHRRVAPRDAGMTLIELLVTMILLAVVSSLVVGAVSQAGRILTHTDDEATGLADAKIILDRLGRDIREARSAVCDGGLADPADPASADPTCQAHLQLWVDANSDYAQQATEVITWRLEQNPDGVHHDVYRVVGTGAGGTPVTSSRQASSLIVNAVFAYDTGSAATARQVDISLEYDSIVGRGSGDRTASLSARLRNKE